MYVLRKTGRKCFDRKAARCIVDSINRKIVDHYALANMRAFEIMKRLLFSSIFVFGLAMVFASGALAQKTVAGEWDAEFNTPGGPQPLKLILKVDGEKLTGTAKRSRGDVALNGTIKGDDITFGYTIDYNGNPVTLTFIGKVKGDAMSGTVTFNDSNSDDWSAKRATTKP